MNRYKTITGKTELLRVDYEMCGVEVWCGVEGKRRLCDLNVTSSSPARVTKTYTLCAVGQ